MSKKIKFYFILAALIIVGIILLLQFGGRSITIKGLKGTEQQEEQEKSSELPSKGGINPITGLECENYNRRPIAVMLAMDPITRPLSGIGAADLVIEMPVITDSITRLMAIYVCKEPIEIGSLRSSRHDFIPLAMGLDAIYAHWGGSHYALDKLNAKIMDNIDALKNPYNAFWQKSGIPMPHNGFTSMARLVNAAEKLGYRLTNRFEGYPHIRDTKHEIPDTKGELTIGYGGSYRVFYEYNPETNSYLRWRGGIEEIDELTNKQVEVQNVVVVRAASRMIEPPDYNDVDIEGAGTAVVYRNGEEIKGTWKKEGRYKPTKLYFLDSKGKEIKFVPGKIWIEIVEPYQEIKWEVK
jgi:hypothetical protein